MANIVCFGGGTGLFTLLPGLKNQYPESRIAAIVSMMDSGGSTGRLRDEFGYLPPGDVRKCLVALSNAPHRLRRLMEHRFDSGKGLKGHSFGNLMLTALKDTIPGTPEEKEWGAIKAMADILNIQGSVYPVTLTNCNLKATLSDGTEILGETNIDVPKHDPSLAIERLELVPDAQIFLETKKAILNANVIVIGPGDLYTSLMPNLIVKGVSDAIWQAKKRGAKIALIVSTMTKHGETDSYTAQTFVDKIEDVIGMDVLDYVLVNNGEISEEQRAAYAAEHSYPVKNDLSDGTFTVIAADLVNKEQFARHHSELLAKALKSVIG